MILDYFDDVGEGIEFLLALGSIMGMLGLIVGILGYLLMGQFKKHKMIPVIVVSIILLAVCGLTTGTKYFRIY